ncbi:MAG: GH36-type glycosyl hydrolase domain-containing protein [Candidatus Eiseniibacteriota bacterium]
MLTSDSPVRVLSNSGYTTVLGPTGTGWSAAGGRTLTRWRADPVQDADGFFVWVRDVESGNLVRAGTSSDGWAPGRWVSTSNLDGLELRLEICVAPDWPAEIRRLTMRNGSPRSRTVQVAAVAEVVLDDASAFAAHPVFSKLFLETELVRERRAILVRRRPRAAGEPHPWLVHAVLGEGSFEHETDRAKLWAPTGRRIGAPSARTARGAPRSIARGTPLSGTSGVVVDPAICLRRTVVVETGAESAVTFLLGVAAARDAALDLVQAFEAEGAVERAFRDAESAEQTSLGRAGPGEADAGALEVLARTEPPAPTATPRPHVSRGEPEPPAEALAFFNGCGGFSASGDEYVVRPASTEDGLLLPPRSWTNVVANEDFGFLVSETGAGCTWSGNSREHRITPWCNDPLLDPHVEALYVRDEETGEAWSLFPGPRPSGGRYEVRHGFGTTRALHRLGELETETTLFVPVDAPVKVSLVELHNSGERPLRLALFAYHQLVLAAVPEPGRKTIVTSLDGESGALFAGNTVAGVDRVAFAAVVPAEHVRRVTFTTERRSFLGSGGSPSDPIALRGEDELDGRSGACLDPCFALQAVVEVPPRGTTTVSFLLGEAAGGPRGEASGAERARAMIARFAEPGAARRALAETRAAWETRVGALRVRTPMPSLDVMVNGWLPYQTLACRLWGRTATYQSGGAFGFRDQLQDACAFVSTWPELTRAQLLLHAAHQFVEGDVLHWWHPPDGRGIRTRFADDLLWLPWAAALYARVTGDAAVLDEPARFLRARELRPGEDEAFLRPEDSGTSASLWEHCCRAVDRSLARGVHGLPLFGTGDWNDGMNRVGREGKGESVWMGFFLFAILGDMADLADQRGDAARARGWREHRETLRGALNADGWDGDWYRRGWYDDGSPLGSRQSDECRIDALAQAWAVLSGAAPAERAVRALDAVERHLVSESDGLIRLLTPAFRNTPKDPGYIKGYVPGIRENGGQYTHAALWVVAAMAELRRHDRVAKLLDMIGPVHRSATPEQVARYQVEPYVVTADIYGEAPHVGRGGWTWYTGSAGWMHRVAVEWLLGMRLDGGRELVLDPCVPDEWPEFEISWRVPGGDTRYEIRVVNPSRRARAVVSATLDGVALSVDGRAARIPIRRDGRVHRVEAVLGDGAAA